MTGGGSPSQRKSGRLPPLDSHSLVFQPQSSHKPADIAAHPGIIPFAAGSGQHLADIPGVAQFNINPGPGGAHQSDIADPVSGNSDPFNDTPYVPPRATQPELHPYAALDPGIHNVYPPNHEIHHQYSYDGGTSPSESQHSTESNWSTPSSSSAASQQLAQPISEYSHSQQLLRHTTYPPYYPAYHGRQRLGFEHMRFGEQPSHSGGSYYRTPPQGYLVTESGMLPPGGFDGSTTRVSIPSPINYHAASSHASSSHASSSSPSSISTINQVPNVSTFSVAPTSLPESRRSVFPDAGPYLRQQLGLSPHDPIDLHSLPDPPPGDKPSTPLPMLIKLAIYGSPNKQLTLQEIYNELENRFQWFRNHKHDKAWKNSIRHNLSLNKVFRNVPRPVTEPGKGSYWQLDVSGGEGYKRPRKRRPKSRTIASEEEDDDASEMDEDRASPFDSSQHVGIPASSTMPIEDSYIDPELRSEGHVVGEGRTRSATRRAGGSPYPASQSPQYQQGPLPVVAAQDIGAASLAQPYVRFGQPSFGQSSFPGTYPQTQSMSADSPSFSYATMSSTSMMMPPTTVAVARPQLQYVASYDRAVPISQPPPQPGLEYVMDTGGSSVTRRVKTYPESQGQSAPEKDAVVRSPSGSSSSGSSRTWNATRSRSDMSDG